MLFFCGISCQIFGLISSFLNNKMLQILTDGKSSQEYPVNAGVPQGSILGPTLSLIYILMSSLMMLFIVLLSMLMILLSTPPVVRYLIFGNS